MKAITFNPLFFFVLITIGSCQTPSTPSEADEAAIRTFVDAFKAAWDVNDEAAMADYFLEDGDLTFPASPWIRGREAITGAFNWDHPEDLTINPVIQDIRFVGPSVALVNIDASFTGGRDQNGNPIPDYWDSATWILQKQNGEWKGAGLRVMPMRQDLAQTEKEIAATWEQFTKYWEAGDIEKAMSSYTEDAENLGSNTPERVGKENIKTLFAEVMANQSASNLKVEQHQLDILGSVAYQYGTFSQTWTDKTGDSGTQKARFMTQLQRGSDGVWRFRRFIFTNVPAD